MTQSYEEEWPDSQLADVIRADSPIGYGIVQPGPYIRGGVPVLAIKDLARPSPRTAHRSAPAIEAAYRRSRIREGDILISVKGTTGRIGLVPKGFVGNISRDVARVRLSDEHVSQFWLQLLQSEASQEILQAATVGSTRQELSIATLKTLRFRFPQKSEQVRIASILQDVDQLVEAQTAFLAKKQAVKDALARELLSHENRENWSELPLAELAVITKGRQLGRADMDERQTVPVWNGGIEPSGFTTTASVSNDVVTVSEGGNSCGWVGRPSEPFWLGGHCYALTPKGPAYGLSFLYHALKVRESQIMALRVGSGLPNIQKRRLSEFRVPVPDSVRRAKEIGTVLDDADEELKSLADCMRKLGEIKLGMMQELLTGRIRMPAKVTHS